MEEQVVLLTKDQGIATLTMNRPQAYNALSPQLIEGVVQALLECEKDPEVKVVIFTGAGKAFCAGGDLPFIEKITGSVEGRGYILQAGRISSTIMALEKPVIAMVNGVAAGAGFNLALACDLIFSAKSATYVQSFSRVGLIPDCGGTFLLPRLIGLSRAKELMFTADPISADAAYAMGIVNRVVEDGKLKEAVLEYAGKLVHSAPIAISLIKRALNFSSRLDLERALELEADLQTVCLQTGDNKEGVKAFKEKRAPQFRGI